MIACTSAKPSGEETETAHAQITKSNAKNIATPVTRWRIDEIAEGGNLIVLSSKFTGLCFFTMYACLIRRDIELPTLLCPVQVNSFITC